MGIELIFLWDLETLEPFLRNLEEQVGGTLAISFAIHVKNMVPVAIIATSVIATSAITAGNRKYLTRNVFLPPGLYPMRGPTISLR